MKMMHIDFNLLCPHGLHIELIWIKNELSRSTLEVVWMQNAGRLDKLTSFVTIINIQAHAI